MTELRIQDLVKVTGENSPECDPQAHRNAEIGVQIVKGMLRV